MRMKKILSNSGGFSLTEVLFAFAISVMVMGVAISGWVFTHNTWSGEKYNTMMRIDILEAVETIKNDIRLSSGTYMSFYPEASNPYTAIMMPRADVDADGLLSIGTDGIEWDRTVFYYMLEDESGTRTLYRSQLNSWNDALDEDGRYALLESVVEGETLPDSTEVLIGDELAGFEISRSGQVIDFYTDSAESVKENNVIAGYFSFEPDDYTITFLVTGRNDDSSGYGFGIDAVRIEPSGSYREAEYYDSTYAPVLMLSSSGRTTTRVHGTEWSNDNYLEYSALIEGDYLSFTDYYDLWRSSAFKNSSPDNVTLYGDEVRAKLELPEDREDVEKEDIVWDAFDEADSSSELGGDINICESSQPAYPVAIRTVVTADKINPGSLPEDDNVRGDMIRVKFSASGADPIEIGAAYITRRDGVSGRSGLENITAGDIDEKHRHQHIFFSGESGVTISAGGEVWSDWVAFPLVLEDDIHYFVSFSVSAESASYKGWEGEDSDTRTYYYYEPASSSYVSCTADNLSNVFTTVSSHGLENGQAVVLSCVEPPGGLINFSCALTPDEMAGTPDWEANFGQVYYVCDATANTFKLSLSPGGAAVAFDSDGDGVTYAKLDVESNNIFVVTEIDAWKKKGSITSKIFDTQLSSPSYNKIKWSEEKPSGTEIAIKARSSNDDKMSGAADWADITGSGTNPHPLSIGTGRHVQYRAEMETEPYWEWTGGTLSYNNYVDEQASYASPHVFPTRGSGEYLAASVDAPWIDDVEIDWPGSGRICAVILDIARRDDFGQVEVDINGEPLVSTIDVTISLEKDFMGRTLTQTNTFEIEPRNRGK